MSVNGKPSVNFFASNINSRAKNADEFYEFKLIWKMIVCMWFKPIQIVMDFHNRMKVIPRQSYQIHVGVQVQVQQNSAGEAIQWENNQRSSILNTNSRISNEITFSYLLMYVSVSAITQ